MGEIQVNETTRMLLGVVLAAYVLGLLALSIVATKKVQNEEDYLVAGRRLPLWLAWGTLIATWFGAASMFAAAENARDEGLRGVILDPFACSATLVLAGLFFARPLWNMKLLTMGDFFRRLYGPNSEVVSSAIQVVSYFAWIALQYTALGQILTYYFGIDPTWARIISASVTLVYTMIGGMWSVTVTDTAQILIALAGLVVLAAATFGHESLGNGDPFRGVEVLVERLSVERPGHLNMLPEKAAGLAGLFAWFGAWATGLFGNIPGQDLQQRVFASRDAKTAAWACILAGVIYQLFGLIPVSLGLASTVTNPGFQGEVLPMLADRYLSNTMSVVFVVSVVSIIVSTATSAVLAPATLLGHNLLGRLRFFHGKGLLLERLCVLLISLGGLALTFMDESLMGLLDVSLSIALVALFVPVLFGIYGKPRGELPGILATGLGFLVWVGRYAFEKIYEPPEDFTGGFHDHIAQIFPAERVGDLAHALLHAYAVVPADLWGLGVSFLGYLIGQAILARRGVAWVPRELTETCEHR